MNSTQELFRIAVIAAQQAALIVKGYYNMHPDKIALEIKEGDGKTPVSKADRAAGRAMIEILLKFLPGIIVVDEDLGKFGDGVGPWSGWIAYLDGIDGTSHFLYRLKSMMPAVGITLTFNEELVGSVIVDLNEEDIMVTEKGAGVRLSSFYGVEWIEVPKPNFSAPVAERMCAVDALHYEMLAPRFAKFNAGIQEEGDGVFGMWKHAQNLRTWASCILHAKYAALCDSYPKILQCATVNLPGTKVYFANLHAIGGNWDMAGALPVSEQGFNCVDAKTGKRVTHLFYGQSFKLVVVYPPGDKFSRFLPLVQGSYGVDYPGFRAMK